MMRDRELNVLWDVAPELAVAALIVASIGLWWALRGRRRRDLAAMSSPPISLLMVEQLARTAQRRGGVLAAIGIVGVPTTMVMQLGPSAAGWALGAIALTIVASIGLRSFFVARDVLAMIEGPGHVTAELDYLTVILRRADKETHLQVSPSALARVRRHAVPRSVARWA